MRAKLDARSSLVNGNKKCVHHNEKYLVSRFYCTCWAESLDLAAGNVPLKERSNGSKTSGFGQGEAVTEP
jgi:hypothetical protein